MSTYSYKWKSQSSYHVFFNDTRYDVTKNLFHIGIDELISEAMRQWFNV